MRYAYLHGLASSPQAHKAVALARALEPKGITLERPDLNVPSLEKLSLEAMLGEVDRMAARSPGELWCLVGSSLGGYVAAYWAERNPSLVRRLLLLCPVIDPGALRPAWSTWPASPEVACLTRIVHGTRDESVPISSSRSYAATRAHVSLLEVDDDHRLVASTPRIIDEAIAFFGI